MPDLHAHFAASGIEPHMYASQWFLTLFAVKVHLLYPLTSFWTIISQTVHPPGCFPYHGRLPFRSILKRLRIEILPHSLLGNWYDDCGFPGFAQELEERLTSQNCTQWMRRNRMMLDLLPLKFEEILNYFRTTMPNLYGDDDAAADLLTAAFKLKVFFYISWCAHTVTRRTLQVAEKKLKKLAADYLQQKHQEAMATDPVNVRHRLSFCFGSCQLRLGSYRGKQATRCREAQITVRAWKTQDRIFEFQGCQDFSFSTWSSYLLMMIRMIMAKHDVDNYEHVVMILLIIIELTWVWWYVPFPQSI